MGGVLLSSCGQHDWGARTGRKTALRSLCFALAKAMRPKPCHEKALAIVELGGRRMGGMIFVAEDACDDEALIQWVSLALSFVAGLLPPK